MKFGKKKILLGVFNLNHKSPELKKKKASDAFALFRAMITRDQSDHSLHFSLYLLTYSEFFHKNSMN